MLRVYEPHREGGLLGRLLHARRLAEPSRIGLHVSTIIDDLRTTQRRAQPKPFPFELMLLFQECGNVLEDLLAGELARRRGGSKPEPRTLHGITGSPDWYNARTRRIEEMKATWVSERTFIEVADDGRVLMESEKFWYYKLQILFYAHLWQVERAALHLLFIAGNHRPPFPIARTLLLRFSRRDTQQVFDLLYQHALDRRLLHVT